MSNAITVNDGVGDTEYLNYSLVEGEGMYRDDSSSLSEPRTLRISHDMSKTADGVDRHLISFARTDDDGDDVPHTGTVHVVFAAPRDGVLQADLIKEWVKLKTLIDAHTATLLGGFQPQT